MDFPAAGPLHYVLVGSRNHSPTDRPEHFVDANTGETLVPVWLAGDDLSDERRVLETLGATIARRDVYAPRAVAADVAQLEEGTVVFLPGARQLVRGRRIVGATVRVRSVETARRTMTSNGLRVPAAVATSEGTSLFVPPALARGLWLEFRQARPSASLRDSSPSPRLRRTR